MNRELNTANILVGLFNQQIAAYEAHHRLGRRARRREIRDGRYDPTIDFRIDGLRAGRAKWQARLDALRAAEEEEKDDESTTG